ncbi:SDR family oxidoreductase [Geomicrobium sp. JSM 1781026]|uniref:SDR family oxidoreductase n=1 Tax=Geomicrobium sp. JSM 1781026 TaxID=3344580 RepID=UPI0035C2254F
MKPQKRNPSPLQGKTVLITGVSRRAGIGYAIAKQCAAYGASIIIQHFRTHDEEQAWGADHLEAVVAGIQQEMIPSAQFGHYHSNFLQEDSAETLIKTVVKEHGAIDAIVCNHARSGGDGPLGNLTAQMLDNHWKVNTRSSVLLAQAFADQYDPTRGRGKIIFMTSGQRQGPMPGEVAYALAKGALADITLTLADQLADQNICVNTVNPGPVDTGYLNDQLWEETRTKFPFDRFGEPEDPARLISWLLTEEASWITGQIMNTEGGFARWRS